MNKRLLILILTSLLTLTSCGSSKKDNEYYISYVGKKLGVDIPSDTSIEYEENYGWFGDGELFAKVVFQEDEESIDTGMGLSNGYWKPLPVPNIISLRIFGGEYDGKHYNYGDDSMKPAQKVTDGVYFFEDRADYSSKGKPFLGRASYNFTFAIYDFKKHTLYFFKCDS